jgi:hypothetical protein
MNFNIVQKLAIWGREIFNEKVQYLKGNLFSKIQNIILFDFFFNLYSTHKAIVFKYDV